MEQPTNQPAETPSPQPSPILRTGSSWKNILPGLFIGILVGVAGILFYQKHQPDITTALYTATKVLFGLVIITFLLFWGLRAYLTRFIFGSKTASAADVLEDAQRVSNVITERFADKMLADLPAEERGRIKNILPRLANWFFWGRLRNWWWQWILGIFVSLGGITGTMLLINQNELLEAQNVKIDSQTILMQQQTELAQQQMFLSEASRRSALVVLMSNIMDKVDEEIKDQKSEMRGKGLSKAAIDTMKFSLSQSLIGQIAALSHSFKPYRFMEADSIIKSPLSPERGQLLITLTHLPLDTSTLNKIFKSSTFMESDLSHANLARVYLCGADLRMANLSGAELRESKLIGIDLYGVNLWAASLVKTDLRHARLTNARFIGTELLYSNLSDADLRGAIFDKSEIRGVNLKGADLSGVIFMFIGKDEINSDLLKGVKSLFWCKGLPDSIITSLQQTHPDLFKVPKY